MNLPNLQERLGPLPVWAWIGVAAGGGLLLQHFHGLSSPASAAANLGASAINPSVDPSQNPGTVLQGGTLPVDPIAQIQALSSAQTAQTQANAQATSGFMANLLTLIQGSPNAPNSVSATLPGGGTLAFGNGANTFGNGTGLTDESVAVAQQQTQLANAQGFWANALAGTQGYWNTAQQYQQGFWDTQKANTTGFWNAAGQQITQGGTVTNPISNATHPAMQGGNPPAPHLMPVPAGNVSAIRAQCQPGDYGCAKAVAPWLQPRTAVW